MNLVNSKSAIIFDLGGVLIDWNPRYLYRRLFRGDETAVEKFLTEICSPEWNAKQDAGRPFSEAIEELFTRYPEQEALILAWVDYWPEMMGGAIELTVEILAELKERGYPLFALSNWSAETFPHARERFEFLSWFDTVVVSGEVKLVKPDRRIFELLLEKIGWQASQCVFIDDAEKNVSVARQLGFQTIHFQSAELLRSELCRLGLLSDLC
jgi:2-haloacid dehalogenase